MKKLTKNERFGIACGGVLFYILVVKVLPILLFY